MKVLSLLFSQSCFSRRCCRNFDSRNRRLSFHVTNQIRQLFKWCKKWSIFFPCKFGRFTTLSMFIAVFDALEAKLYYVQITDLNIPEWFNWKLIQCLDTFCEWLPVSVFVWKSKPNFAWFSFCYLLSQMLRLMWQMAKN